VNKLGAEGREVVSAVSVQPNQVRIILKRCKAQRDCYDFRRVEGLEEPTH
jgi:hypothetical protein